ncbi:hypothetical protein ES703_114081 [subsurface metagenome]
MATKSTRYDLHPNSKRFEIELSAANAVTEGEFELFEPVHIQNGKKVLVAEILKIILTDDTSVGTSHQVIELRKSDGETPWLSYRRGSVNLVGESGTYLFDLSDGQGHGYILTKNPTWYMDSVAFAAVAHATITFLWRFIEISAQELVAMLAGGI